MQREAPPPAPQAPTAELPGTAPIRLGPELPLPQTAADLAAVRRRRSELSDQLISASNRREEIAGQLLVTNDPVARAGLQQRLKVLDDRIARLELDIDATGQQLTNASTSALVEPDGPPWETMNSGQLTGISIVFTIFVLFPLALSASRMMWRRATRPGPRRDPADVERFERIEQAIDSIAVEVERIGEGQRFMTRLLTDSNGAVPLLEKKREELVRTRTDKG